MSVFAVAIHYSSMCYTDSPWNALPSASTDSVLYDGQVQLLHPNTTLPGQQVSFGLVYVHIQQRWGTIYQNVPLSSYTADSLCIQLGYTQADPLSITTRQLSNAFFSP